MSWWVHIEDDWVGSRLRIYLHEESGGAYLVMARGGEVKILAPGTAAEPEDYLAAIPYQAAPALLAALARQLGAVEHPEQLRRDYEHERGRVDKMLDWLMKRPA